MFLRKTSYQVVKWLLNVSITDPLILLKIITSETGVGLRVWKGKQEYENEPRVGSFNLIAMRGSFVEV